MFQLYVLLSLLCLIVTFYSHKLFCLVGYLFLTRQLLLYFTDYRQLRKIIVAINLLEMVYKSSLVWLDHFYFKESGDFAVQARFLWKSHQTLCHHNGPQIKMKKEV